MNAAAHPSYPIHVVDDDTNFLSALNRLLLQHGYSVYLHNSGAEFIENYDQTPACLILDLKMPRMSGDTLLEIVKENNWPLVTIILSGQATLKNALNLGRSGAIDFIEKPFDPEKLIEAIEDAFSRSSATFAKHALRIDHQKKLDTLTPRENEVMQWILAGLTSHEISLKLAISKKTVDIHRSRVLQKMHASNTVELIRNHITTTKPFS